MIMFMVRLTVREFHRDLVCSGGLLKFLFRIMVRVGVKVTGLPCSRGIWCVLEGF